MFNLGERERTAGEWRSSLVTGFQKKRTAPEFYLYRVSSMGPHGIVDCEFVVGLSQRDV